MLAATLAIAIAAGCGTGSSTHARPSAAQSSHGGAGAGRAEAPPPPPPPALLVTARPEPRARWRAFAHVHGEPAAWWAQRGGVTLMRFDQRLVHLDLHAGVIDGGESGWRYGDRVTPSEVHRLVAGFNGGFKLTYSGVGFVSGRHTAVALSPGLGSLVTYTDGTSAIGAWRSGVPDPARTVYSVLQNQRLLIDRGRAAASVEGCILSCWGSTIGNATVVPRTALGVRADGMLVWAGGEQLTPARLARALIAAGAVRAIELDINPFWVAGYVYVHHPGGPTAVPVIPGQHGIAGQLLEPDQRDFLAVVANR